MPEPDRLKRTLSLPRGLLHLAAAMGACVALVLGGWTLRGVLDALERRVYPDFDGDSAPPSEVPRDLSLRLDRPAAGGGGGRAGEMRPATTAPPA